VLDKTLVVVGGRPVVVSGFGFVVVVDTDRSGDVRLSRVVVGS